MDNNKSNEFFRQINCFNPGIFLNISPNWRRSLQMELWNYRYNISINDSSNLLVKNISVPIMLKREYLYHRKVNPFINFGIDLSYNYKALVEDYFKEYTKPIYKDDSIIGREHILYELDELELESDRKVSLYLLAGTGFSYDINPKNTIYFEIRGRIKYKDKFYAGSSSYNYYWWSTKNVSYMISYSYNF